MMKVASSSIGWLALTCVALSSGCKKTESAAPAAATTSAPQPAATPAVASAVIAPPPASAAAESGPTEITPVAAANGVKVSASSGTGLPWALKQDEIRNDTRGQWASVATASSSFGDAKGEASYAPSQATGAPNVDKESDSGSAWCPRTADAGIEWLDLTFPKAVLADGLRIRENDGAGAIVKIDLYDEQGKIQPLWSGTDPTTSLNYLILSFPKTSFKTNRVKITLATNLVPGYNQIDAVQLLGEER